MNENNGRRLLGVAIPVASAAVLFVPYLLVRSDLPDRVATHFDASGTPDGSMTPTTFLLVCLAMTGLGVTACVWLALTRRRLLPSIAPLVGFLGGFFAGLGSGIAVVTFVGQRGLDSWVEASNVWALIVLPVVAALGLGVLGARAAVALPAQVMAIESTTQLTMDLGVDQTAVWVSTQHSKLLAGMGVAFIAVGALVALGTFWWIMLPSVIVGVAMLSLATLHVRADRLGLHVKYGLLPWPRTRVSVDEIEAVSAIDVRPMQWGGWGYRGSLKLMNQAAVVHRAGPGIKVDLRNGKVFVVTVDHPENAVALLNAEVARTVAA